MKPRTSSTTTFRPVSRSARTRWPPMKPAPPVTSVVRSATCLRSPRRACRCRFPAAPCPARSALAHPWTAPDREPSHEVPLQEDPEEQRRDERDQRHRARLALEVSLEEPAMSGQDHRQRHRRCRSPAPGEEELRPREDERERGCRDQPGRGERDGDLPERLPAACTRRRAPPARARRASGGSTSTSSRPSTAARRPCRGGSGRSACPSSRNPNHSSLYWL